MHAMVNFEVIAFRPVCNRLEHIRVELCYFLHRLPSTIDSWKPRARLAVVACAEVSMHREQSQFLSQLLA